MADIDSHNHDEAVKKQQITILLKDKNISATRQRVDMAEFLLREAQHLTADDIYSRVNEKFKKVSRATVYNNLGLFVEAGLLKKINLTPSVTIYDTNISDHFHFIDNRTGSIHDLEDSELHDRLIETARERLNTETGRIADIENLQVLIRGTLQD